MCQSDISVLGEIAATRNHSLSKYLLANLDKKQDDFNFNLKLFIARKKAEHEIYGSKLSESSFFYFQVYRLKQLFSKDFLFRRI